MIELIIISVQVIAGGVGRVNAPVTGHAPDTGHYILKTVPPLRLEVQIYQTWHQCKA